jgi:Sulfatase-modifying factor enzyme 1
MTVVHAMPFAAEDYVWRLHRFRNEALAKFQHESAIAGPSQCRPLPAPARYALSAATALRRGARLDALGGEHPLLAESLYDLATINLDAHEWQAAYDTAQRATKVLAGRVAQLGTFRGETAEASLRLAKAQRVTLARAAMHLVASSEKGPALDGSAVKASSCNLHILRGGAWNCYPQLLRAAYRYASAPDVRMENAGFRVARSMQ